LAIYFHIKKWALVNKSIVQMGDVSRRSGSQEVARPVTTVDLRWRMLAAFAM
jgi:hypothetical protein